MASSMGVPINDGHGYRRTIGSNCGDRMSSYMLTQMPWWRDDVQFEGRRDPFRTRKPERDGEHMAAYPSGVVDKIPQSHGLGGSAQLDQYRVDPVSSHAVESDDTHCDWVPFTRLARVRS